MPNARVSTSIIYGNSAVSVDKFSNIRMYVVNNHADAYLSFRFEGMSLRTGDKYYTVDINSGAIRRRFTARIKLQNQLTATALTKWYLI